MVLALLICTNFLGSQPGFPTGQVIERIVCAADSGQSYALYLPSNYDASRNWPIILALDPGARGAMPVNHFKKAAEQYGYLLVGSNNSKNGPTQVGFNALTAMWEDAYERFSIDTNRVYLAGFSGGARLAGQFAQLSRVVRGVIGCGAGFTIGESKETLAFSFVGISGSWDMNFLELRTLNADLLRRKVNSRLITFEGGHQWPPPHVCREAVQWLELASFREGLQEEDQQLVQDLYQRELKKAEDLEQSGRYFQAYLTYLDLRNDLQPLRNLNEVERRIAALAGSARLKSSWKKAEKLENLEARYLKELLKEFLDVERRRELEWWEGKIESIRRAAEKHADPEHQLVVKRLLEFIWRNGYERSWFEAESRHFERATYLAQVSLLPDPKAPYLLYNLSRIYALQGHLEPALENLEKAVSTGLIDLDQVRTDSAFSSFSRVEEFQRILFSPAPEVK